MRRHLVDEGYRFLKLALTFFPLHYRRFLILTLVIHGNYLCGYFEIVPGQV
jgi:hypothetical protein